MYSKFPIVATTQCTDKTNMQQMHTHHAQKKVNDFLLMEPWNTFKLMANVHPFDKDWGLMLTNGE